MTIRLDDKLGAVLVDGDKSEALFPAKTKRRYHVYVDGTPAFASKHVAGDRVKALLTMGVSPNRIMVLDTVTGQQFGGEVKK